MTFLWALLAFALHVLPGAVAPAHAQGSRKDDIVFNSRGVPLAGATVRVCAMPASGQPCTPLALIYSDAALTQALANPTTTDGLGNYFFYAAPGKYEIEISGPGITTKQIPNVTLPNDPSSPSFTGGISAFSLTLSGNLTVSGNTTVVGNLASGTLNLSNQSTPPGAAGSGTVNLYTKTTDKRLYYKDDTGTEIGPVLPGAATNVTNTFTSGQNFDGDVAFKGTNPYVDVRRYGAVSRNTSSAPAVPGITASCTSNSPNVTISSASTFAAGEGVVLYNCGTAHSMTTPSAPTVTPSLAQAGTGTGIDVNGPTGSTSYSYQIVARNTAQGLTAASPATTVTTGQATLGSNSNALTSCSRSGNVATCITSTAHTLAVGAQVRLTQTSTGAFSGMYQVTTVPDNTHFTFNSGINGTDTSTGGTVFYWNSNRITWTAVTGAVQYFIYGCSGAACSPTLIGASWPQLGGGTASLYWDDWGATMRGSPNFPYFVPSTPPGSATNNSLVTTISSGAGTTSLTLAANAGNTASGQTILADACGPMVTAAGSGFQNITIPNGSFVCNSYAAIPNGTTIAQVGTLSLNDTVQLPAASGAKWKGEVYPAGWNAGQFSLDGGAPISISRAWPGISLLPGSATSSGKLERLNVTVPNGQIGIFGDQLLGFTMDSVQIANNGGTDLMGMGVVILGVVNNTSFPTHANRIMLAGSQPSNAGQTATPYFFCAFCGQARFTSIMASGRGILGRFGDVFLDGGRIQGGAGPFFTQVSSSGAPAGSVSLHNYQLDTIAGPMFTLFSDVGTGVVTGGPVWLDNVGSPSSDGVAVQPNITGDTSKARILISGNTPSFGNNSGLTSVFGGQASVAGNIATVGVQASGSGNAVGYAMVTPAAPSVVAGASGSCSSNCVASGTKFYATIAVDVANRYTTISPATSVTVDGTQTVTVTPSLVNGQVGFIPGRGTSATNITTPFAAGNSPFLCGGLSYVDGTNAPANLGPCNLFYSQGLPNTATGNAESLSSAGVSGHQINLTAGGFNNVIAPPSGGFTANRTTTIPDVTGIVPTSSYQNSVYDNATRANGAIGSNWTVTNNGINVSSNNFVGTATSNDVAYWSVNAFSPVQFSQVTLTALNGTTDFPGTAVLLSGSGASTHGYNCVEDTTNVFIQKITGTSNTTLTSASTTGVAGDILRLEVDSAGNLTCFKNGVSTLTVNDTSYTSGSPGLFLLGTVATSKNWSGGNLHPLAHLDTEQDWTKTQHFVQGIALGGAASESFNNNPRAEQNVFLPGALTSTWTGSTWTTDKAVTVTRLQVQAKTAPSGCATNAVVRLTDGTTPVNVTISAAANDSGVITQNYTAGASLTIAVQTAASGCTTSPADANVTVQYRMQ